MKGEEIQTSIRSTKKQIRKTTKALDCRVVFGDWEIRIVHPSQGHSSLVLPYWLHSVDGGVDFDEHRTAL